MVVNWSRPTNRAAIVGISLALLSGGVLAGWKLSNQTPVRPAASRVVANSKSGPSHPLNGRLAVDSSYAVCLPTQLQFSGGGGGLGRHAGLRTPVHLQEHIRRNLQPLRLPHSGVLSQRLHSSRVAHSARLHWTRWRRQPAISAVPRQRNPSKQHRGGLARHGQLLPI